jgi:hypothetical protein
VIKPPYQATMWVGIDGGRPCPLAVLARVRGGHVEVAGAG